ncbi:MAG: sulfatase [Deltaproteobacteria bacterium]|nr:sulfatase [Deltaproteobacteria bacterium]
MTFIPRPARFETSIRLPVLSVLLPLCIWSAAGCSSEPEAARGDILVVILDTVRRDRLSAYGYERKTSPVLESLSAASRKYTNAYATSGWTTPSHASLFTGLYPVRHGATQENWQLSQEVNSLAEVLQDAGYQTVGVTGNAMITAERGFDQGFEIYHESWRGAPNRARDAISVEWVKTFLAERDDPRPLFLFVNLIGAHTPYDSCGKSCAAFGAKLDGQLTDSFWKDFYLGRRAFTSLQFDRLRRLYDAEVKEVDANLGRILIAFDYTRDPATSLVAVASDHGENIGDHGHVNHVFSLYETTIQIPLVIRYPKAFARGSVDERPVQLVDLFPTLLAVAGLARDDYPSHGRNLLEDDASPRTILTEYYRPEQAMIRLFTDVERPNERRVSAYQRRLRTISRDGWKLIWGSDGKHELYHLAQDPEEANNLIADPRAAVERDGLIEELNALIERYGQGERFSTEGHSTLDKATQQELRALGYLE